MFQMSSETIYLLQVKVVCTQLSNSMADRFSASGAGTDQDIFPSIVNQAVIEWYTWCMNDSVVDKWILLKTI